LPSFTIGALGTHGDALAASDDTRYRSDAPRTVAARPQSGDRLVSGVVIAVAVYLVGAALFLVRLGIGVRRAWTIRRDAMLVDGRLTHPACMTPMTVGVIAPAVILPTDWTEWDDADLSAVLTHEEAHARRRDPLVGAIALLNRAIFWFHPLAWWLQREIGRLAEQACDAAVISGGHDRERYSACLLRFARRAAHAGGRVVPIGVAMPGIGLHERLGMLARLDTTRPSHLRLACAALVATALVVVCSAAAPTAAPAQTASGAAGRVAWRVDTSEHFEIVHDNLSADRVSKAITDAEAAYAQLTEALKHDMPRRISLVLVRRDRDLASGAAYGFDVVGPTVVPSRERVVISLESLDQRPGLIVHELTHAFALEIVPATSRATPVLIEGLAQHQRGAWDAEELQVMRADVAVQSIPSVADLHDVDRHWAHAMFDFVAEQNGEEGVRRLLFALRAHATLAAAVPMAFGETLAQFDEAFRRYVTNRFSQP
jgi:BlaR1 peptidase M56